MATNLCNICDSRIVCNSSAALYHCAWSCWTSTIWHPLHSFGRYARRPAAARVWQNAKFLGTSESHSSTISGGSQDRLHKYNERINSCEVRRVFSSVQPSLVRTIELETRLGLVFSGRHVPPPHRQLLLNGNFDSRPPVFSEFRFDRNETVSLLRLQPICRVHCS